MPPSSAQDRARLPRMAASLAPGSIPPYGIGGKPTRRYKRPVLRLAFGARSPPYPPTIPCPRNGPIPGALDQCRRQQLDELVGLATSGGPPAVGPLRPDL